MCLFFDDQKPQKPFHGLDLNDPKPERQRPLVLKPIKVLYKKVLHV